MPRGNSPKSRDKAEGNAEQINGHPAWGSVWDIASNTATLMDIKTNVFCASGMHLPNGSYVTFGGNGAVIVGGEKGSDLNPGGFSAHFDQTYGDFDGTKSIRILNPCTNADDMSSPECQWFDDPSVLSMQRQRWYSAAEPLGDGRIVIIGFFANGGYVNRGSPDDPDRGFEGNASEPTFEWYPPTGETPQLMQSGKMFLQAYLKTILWDPDTNTEAPLPDMPNGIVRVYPASGAVAMLPLTPSNNWNPTILFCGGNDMDNEAWGNYSWPFINTWEKPASSSCHRITPEPEDGSSPVYTQDDSMLESRTMGQFIILPTGKLLVVNGGLNGTAGCANQTLLTESFSDMPFGMSLASGPVGTPAEYDPNAASGSRWSNQGFSSSQIARLYHSSAILLPDASVMIAGSNPSVDVNLTTVTTVFPTTYKAEIFYPSYFSASTRPTPSGIPKTLSYGGSSFDITVPSSSYSGSANNAAENTHVSVVRPGWTTHAMNMGQRYLQLNNTYTVNSDGSIVLHVSQMPPIPNIFQPGPAMVFVVVNEIPSNGTFVIVGSGRIETQSTADVQELPAKVQADSSVSGSADGSTTGAGNATGMGTGMGSSEDPNTGVTILASRFGVLVAVGIMGFSFGHSMW
ncbi:DUF1929-domain-containing protein [Dendrothele bispora CBS 962.96]|uniref:DUF1929-domain-containing protein n=1 Tax=Dendrothele bispora (strain CBS 962.96) TaxID=1314807 RepID=A0A4S8KXR9_DENBC|nr:DUF1929-domain-containing protein [Dendrothele bispora CBS 962.96]